MPAAAPARSAWRPRAAAPRSWPSTSRRRWSASPRERTADDRGRRAHRLPGRRHARPGARPLRPRRRDGFADPLQRRRHRRGRWPNSACARTARCVFTVAPAHALLTLMHTAGRAVPARRPGAGHRADHARRPAPPDRRGAGTGRASGSRGRSASTAGSISRTRSSSGGPDESSAASPTRALDALGPSIMPFMPFADAATPELPMGRLLRLSLFQVTVGMAAVLLIGTLNRVMIVELGGPGLDRRRDAVAAADLRALAGAGRLPLGHPPLGARLAARALHLVRHAAAVRRARHHALRPADPVGRHHRPDLAGPCRRRHWPSCMVGAGLHTTQTVGLALATDLAPAHARPRVVALLCVMLLVGMVVSAVAFGLLLADFSALRLIQVIQGAALVTLVLNGIALWKQEPRDPSPHGDAAAPRRPSRNPGRVYAGKRPGAPPPRRHRARHRRLLDAGHPARALWRPDPAPAGGRHHGADRAAGGRRRPRPARRGPLARPGRRRLPGRGLRRGGGHRRLLGGGLRRAARIRPSSSPPASS